MPAKKGRPDNLKPTNNQRLPQRTEKSDLYIIEKIKLNIMPHHRNGAIDARAVLKKYYPQGGDFFYKQAKRTLAALASARL